MADKNIVDIRGLLRSGRKKGAGGHSRSQFVFSVAERQILNTVRAKGGMVTEARFGLLVEQYGVAVVGRRGEPAGEPVGKGGKGRYSGKKSASKGSRSGGGSASSSGKVVSPISKPPASKAGSVGSREEENLRVRRRVYDLLNNGLSCVGTERLVRVWDKWDARHLYVLGDCGKVDAYCDVGKLPEAIGGCFCEALATIKALLKREFGIQPMKSVYMAVQKAMNISKDKFIVLIHYMQKNGYVGGKQGKEGEMKGRFEIWMGPRLLALDEDIIEWYASWGNGSGFPSTPRRKYAFKLDSDDEADFC